MKEQRKKTEYLHRTNKRWKWMAGATAAGMTATQAGAITINLNNNFISATGGNHLNADLTGDGKADITIKNAFNSVFTQLPTFSGTLSIARVNINGVRARAFYHAYDLNGYAILGLRGGNFYYGGHTNNPTSGIGTATLTGSVPILFKDLHINGGALTKGSLEVTVIGPRPEVRLDSLTYEAHGVPDQGSSLALLAMGAGGILALRRLRGAQARS